MSAIIPRSFGNERGSTHMAKGIAHRDWSIQRSDYQTDQDFNDAVQQELALGQHLMERLGVAIIAAPIRKRSPFGGGWFTEAVIFRTATVPAAREQASEVEALEDALEDEPALVEDPDPLGVAE
jgi:hypothetical protein